MDTPSIMTGAGTPKTARLFRFLARWSLYLTFFLVPLVFSPWTTEALEINKQIVLIILTALGVMAWLGGMVTARELSFRSKGYNFVLLALLAGITLSTLFSMAGYQSWIGQLAQEYTSFLTLASFILLFFLVMNTAEAKGQQIGLLRALFIGAILSGLLAVLGLLNILHLPFAFAANNGFNTVGSVNSLAAYLVVLMFLGLAMWTFNEPGKEDVIPGGWFGLGCRIMIALITLITLFVLGAVDYWIFWAIALIGAAVLVTFHFVHSSHWPSPKRFILPFLVVVVSLLMLFVKTPLNLNFPVTVTPSYSTSWDITQKSLTANWKNLLLGTGPGTFIFSYDQFKPAQINGTAFWNVRFDRAKSTFLTMLSTFGLLNLILAVLLFGLLGLQALSRLLFERDHAEWKMTCVIFTGWLAAVLFQIFSAANFTLAFLFWGLSGMLAAQVFTKVWKKRFAEAPRLSLAMSFMFVLLMIGVLAGVFVSYRRYTAEIAFAQAVQLDQSQAKLDEVIGTLVTATQRNGLSDVYYRNLSTALLLKAGEVIAAAKGEKLSDDQIKQVNGLVQAGVAAAQNATNLEPNNVANWVALGAIYRDLMPYAANAESFAVTTLTRAIALEPANPVHYANLGRVYLGIANRLNTWQSSKDEKVKSEAAQAEAQQLALAEQALSAAINLKPDYALAHYYLVVTMERQGRLAEAAARLEALVQANPTNVGLAFELGVLELQLQELDKAQKSFEQVLTLSPDYSDAMWFLASVYELQKNQPKALELVEKVAKLNPDNELVNKRLEKMRAGEMTTIIPKPLEEGEAAAATVEGQPVEGGTTETPSLPTAPEEKKTTF